VCVAGEGRVLRSAAYPVESAAQFAGDAGKVIGREASAFREALAASYRSPETTVGEAIVGFGAVEMVGQLILGDVTDEADMSSRRLQGTVAVEGVEVAAVPGTAEEWREVTFLAREEVKDAGELLGKHEEAAVGGLLLITHGVVPLL
jgi:hypothetical protein